MSSRDDTIRALSIARAALLEVGADPMLVKIRRSRYDPSRWTLSTPKGHRIARRACRIGRMSVSGPDALVRCDLCIVDWKNPPCIPVRDALRGVTCRSEF